jgi:type I restriction-modification system DNA methylase subunit
MTDEQTTEIRRRLDDELSLDNFRRGYLGEEEKATQFFQELFVEGLDFEETVSSLGNAPWQDIPVHEWPTTARVNAARLFAESGNFRIVYVEIEKLTRTAERNAIQSLTRSDRTSGWAIDGSFLTVFHAPDEDIWHLVTPYEEGTDDITAGRPVLRRYTLGKGETHRTVANALSSMDASKGRLAERIDEAFQVKPVTEDFYENYKSTFDTLTTELRRKGLGIEDADRYAHTTLNRLLFFYYLQKKGWIGDRKDFVRWFHRQYERSDEVDVFHEKWLSALFFDGMNGPEGGEVAVDLPSAVESAIAGLPYMNGRLFQPTAEDEREVFVSDSALESVIDGFLEQYNFTVTEESPYDIDVAVDPAMLGKIYESLIAEQERGEAGIFYTPRTEVDMMCRVAVYEQLATRSPLNGSRLVEFVFTEPREWDIESDSEREALLDVIRELNVVDPACGSGAFLVGMKQVLTELYRKLGETPDYDLKERIINENLHGVDIKGWAVRVAEFRLWLSLIRGEDELPDGRPVLPNFSFKLHTGDSLIQSVGSIELPSFEEIRRDATEDVFKKLQELEAAKDGFFKGTIDDWTIIEEKQTGLLIAYIDDRVESLESAATTQSTLGGGATESSRQSAAEAQAQIEQLETLRERILADEFTDFIWELNYPEVMLDGGFDVVIGNPPYVRQEDIVDQGINPTRLEELSADEVSDLKSEYKEDLREFVETRFGVTPYKTSDLYLYFYFRSMDLLREGGTLSFVTSNSWLDVDYGVRLQEFLLTRGDIKYILENRSQRTFEEADINTIISIINKGSPERLTGRPSFVSVYDPYSQFTDTETLNRVLVDDGKESETLSFQGNDLVVRDRGSWRSIELSAAALWRLGAGTTTPTGNGDDETIPQGRYSSGKWGKYTRAPTVFFELAGKTDRSLSRLGDECTIKRGTRTGANQFFYLPSKYYDARREGETLVLESTGEWPDEEYETELHVPREYWMHHTDDGWEPNLVLKTSKSFDTTIFDLDSLELGNGLRYLLVIDDPRSDLAGDITEYVEWGETYDPGRDDLGRKRTGFPSSVSGRGSDWYDLSEDLQRGDVLPMKNINTRHVYWFPEQRTWIDDRLHGIEVPGEERNRRFLAGVLNSTYGTLSCEVNGRVNLGHGALDIATDDHKATLVPPLEQVDRDLKAEIAERFETLGTRRVSSIFDELGASKPAELSFDSVGDDRLELDRLVIQDLFGFDEDTHRQVYEGTLELVSQRISKADSVWG